LELGNKLFVHAGFVPALPLEQDSVQVLVWDRYLLKDAWEADNYRREAQIIKYDDILSDTRQQSFIGRLSRFMFATCGIWTPAPVGQAS